MSFKAGIIIQARMDSKRLPGKVMMQINGRPMIYYLLKRVQFSKIKNIFIATSINKENDVLIDYIKNNFNTIHVFRGAENNVFSRYYEISKINNLDIIIRVTADCPLIDSRIIDKMHSIFIKNTNKLDYLSNTTPEDQRTYPDGMDVEIISIEALKKANNLNLSSFDLEHVTTCFLNHDYQFNSKKIDFKSNLSYLHLSVDYQHDFDLISNIIKKLIINNINASLEDILKVMD